MKLYADAPTRRTRQILSDVAVVVWVLIWVELGRIVYSAVHKLGASGRELENAGNGLSHSLGDAADHTGSVPFVGSPLAAPLRSARDAAAQVAHAGAVEQTAVGRASLLLGLMIALVPIAALAVVWLPFRLRWIRTATATVQAAAADADLLAIRALTHRPLRQLQRVHPTPGAAYIAGDPVVIADLARLELSTLGLKP